MHVGRQDAPGDRGKAPHHDRIQLGHRHPRDIGTNRQRGFGLSHENIRGGRQAFRTAGPQSPLHDPGKKSDHPLHDAQVIEHRH